MNKKLWITGLIGLLVFVLAACSSLSLPGTTGGQTGQTPAAGQGNPMGNMGDQPVEDKLAFGTLALEDTDLAVTAEQAGQLLPLWKAVRSLSNSENASQEEINAVYQQIQDAMSADQIQTIQNLTLAPEDMQALMAKYGIEMPQGRPEMSGTPNANSEQPQRGAGDGMGMGGPPAGGDFGGGGPGGGMPPEGGFGAGAQSGQSTPEAGQTTRRFRGGMNTMLLDPLIQLLEERAGS